MLSASALAWACDAVGARDTVEAHDDTFIFFSVTDAANPRKNNSFPVAYSLEPVSEAMCAALPLFHPSMQWASVDESHLEYTMRMVALKQYDPDICLQAAATTKTFGPDQIRQTIALLLHKAE